MGVKFQNFHFIKKVMLNKKRGKNERKKIFKKT